MKFIFSSPGKPEVTRTTEETDTVLRVALGDNAHTTGLMQDLYLGIRERYSFTLKGVDITVRLAPAE